jgi:hypothetical protein
MITPDEIKKKAENKYKTFLRELVEDIPFSRLVIAGDKSYSRASWPDFQKEMDSIISHSKEKKGFGYTLEFQRVKTGYLGVQDLPRLICFETESDFLRFLGKEKEIELFKMDVSMITESFPALRDWIAKNPGKVVDNHGKWDSLLKVCRYFQDNPKPELYIRALPVAVHTKFIEQHQGVLRELLDVVIPEYINSGENHFEKRYNLKYREPQIRFKVLDKSLARQFFSGIDDLAIPVSLFETLNLPLKSVLIVENKTTLYTTLTLPQMRGTIAVFGQGNAVLNLRNTSWLTGTEILYWGDLDVHGFEILSRLRGYFPHTRSVLMDKSTFDRFFEDDEGAVSGNMILPNLTEEELALYELLKTNNWRLEQEKIPRNYVDIFFDEFVSSPE